MRSAPALRYLALAAFLAVIVASLGTSFAEPRTAHALENCTVSGTDLAQDGEEQAFLNLINAYRAQSGAPALVVTQPLTRAASWFAADMANLNYFPGDHVDLLGRDPFTRMAQCDVPGYDSAGENIIAGYATAQAAINYWKTSPGHNENMLRPSFRAIGIARSTKPGSTYGTYWSTTFSTVTDGGAAPPAAGAPPPQPAPEPPAPPPPPPPACSAVAVSSNQQATVTPNSKVVFTANPTCPGTPTVQWWGAYVFPNGNQLWEQITNYGASRTYTWTAPATPGNYLVGVWAKVDGSSPAGGFDTSALVNVTVANPRPAPCTAVSLTPPAGTTKIGQANKFTAKATCAGTAQYQWWAALVLANGTQSWQPLTQFGGTDTYTWTPTAAGTYLIGVWVKNQGSSPSGGYETSATNQFVVAP